MTELKASEWELGVVKGVEPPEGEGWIFVEWKVLAPSVGNIIWCVISLWKRKRGGK